MCVTNQFAIATLTILVCHFPAFSAVDVPSNSCRPGHYEIAYFKSSIGTFYDSSYDRTLSKDVPVCTDSVIGIKKDGRRSNRDRLELRGSLGDSIPPFVCQDQMDCSKLSLDDLKAKYHAAQRGKSLLQSIDEFLRRPPGQSSTISGPPRAYFFDRNPVARRFAMTPGLILAGQSIDESVLFPGGFPAEITPMLDICRNAEKRPCGDSLPRSFPFRRNELPELFRNIPAGLHLIFESKPLPGDTRPIRGPNRTFVLAAHESWKGRLAEVQATWFDALAKEKIEPAQLNAYLVYLGTELAKPGAPPPSRE